MRTLLEDRPDRPLPCDYTLTNIRTYLLKYHGIVQVVATLAKAKLDEHPARMLPITRPRDPPVAQSFLDPPFDAVLSSHNGSSKSEPSHPTRPARGKKRAEKEKVIKKKAKVKGRS